MSLAMFVIGILVMLAQGAAEQKLEEQCAAYLNERNLTSYADLIKYAGDNYCPAQPDGGDRDSFHPNVVPSIEGATDTTNLGCRLVDTTSKNNGYWDMCCGWRPHFNWVISTCEDGNSSLFCQDIPDCVLKEGVKINYVAAYQYNGDQFKLMDESSVGDFSDDGIAGKYPDSGWEKEKNKFGWEAGDWGTKYAPHGKGVDGPRGITPPGALWVLSAENFYYGAFYFLSQLTLNLEANGHGPSDDHMNCWTWEFDNVEGSAGWFVGAKEDGEGGDLVSNLNQLFATSNAQYSPCMPVHETGHKAQGNKDTFLFPEQFRDYCKANPTGAGCQPWEEGQDVHWAGTALGSNKFENLWNEPYVFAVVLDRQGSWTYRWRPDPETGHTGWSGIERYSAARTLDPRPCPVHDKRGLVSDVAGDVKESVLLLPSVLPEGACLRSVIEDPKESAGIWAGIPLAAMAEQLGGGEDFDGIHNWWMHFDDTKQNQDYPLSIAGVPPEKQTFECQSRASFGCDCSTGREGETTLHACGGQSDALPPLAAPTRLGRKVLLAGTLLLVLCVFLGGALAQDRGIVDRAFGVCGTERGQELRQRLPLERFPPA